jgi:hypothetical protein
MYEYAVWHWKKQGAEVTSSDEEVMPGRGML